MPRPTASPPARLRTAAAALGAGVVLALVAAPAYAHNELRTTDPADGATLVQPPSQVVLTFAQPPVALGTEVVVTGPAGPVSSGAPRLVGKDVAVDVDPQAPAGYYTIEWRVTSDDGHTESGTTSFAAQTAASGGPSAGAASPVAAPDPAEVGREPLIPSWGWIIAGVIAIVAAVRLNRRAAALNKQQED